MMRIRMWNAFASNNSGSYTLVGRFRTEDDARSLAAQLERVFAQHQAWVDSESKDEPPLSVLAREQALASNDPIGRWDDTWPHYGSPPEVLAVGTQLLVHVPYTISMPRLVGELMYRRGGRVEAELDHTHHPLLLQLEVWADWQLGDHERPRRTHAFRQSVESGAFAPALVPPPYDAREPWPPAFRERECLEVTMAPTDLVLAARLADELATAHGVQLRIRVFESPYEHGNPLPLLRAPVSPHPPCNVVLWSAGPDPLQVMRAVRDVLGVSLAVAKEKIAAAPIELLVDIPEHDACAAVETLNAVGCEAEIVRPKPQ